MTKAFTYTTEESYNEFVLNMANNQDDPINTIKQQSGLMRMLDSRYFPKGWNEEKALPTVEVMLNYLEQHEEYELCQSIINVWPELIQTENK